MLASFKICFCKTNKFESKVSLIEQARNIVNDKLDIVLYIRNVILFEMINKIYLENKSIINFLSRPIIYINDEEEKEEKEEKQQKQQNNINNKDTDISYDSFEMEEKNQEKILGRNEARTLLYLQGGDYYKSAYRFKTESLSNKIEQLIINNGQTNTRKKIIYYLKKHLEGVKIND